MNRRARRAAAAAANAAAVRTADAVPAAPAIPVTPMPTRHLQVETPRPGEGMPVSIPMAATAIDEPETRRVVDGLANFALRIGRGTDNANSLSRFVPNNLSRAQYEQLEAMYETSWIAQATVDTIADDMTRAGIELRGLDPGQVDEMNRNLTALQFWPSMLSALKLDRLYGGAIAVLDIEGQSLSSPLRLETITKGSFNGLIVLDRWLLTVNINDSVGTGAGPNGWRPRFYTANPGLPGIPTGPIHHSRVIRLDGEFLPLRKRWMNQGWGLSCLERLVEAVTGYATATAGVEQLLSKAHLRVVKIDKLRNIIGSDVEETVFKYLEALRRFQSFEGVFAMDSRDEFATHSYAFGGLRDVLQEFAVQVSGATTIPIVKLFGQSAAGLNATGDNDVRNYYDAIKQRQESKLRHPFGVLLDVVHRSVFGRPPNDQFGFDFVSLWQPSEAERTTMAGQVVTGVTGLVNAGVYDRAQALTELREASKRTGMFRSIDDEQIEAAEEEEPPAGVGDEVDAAAGDDPMADAHGAGSTAGPRANGISGAIDLDAVRRRLRSDPRFGTRTADGEREERAFDVRLLLDGTTRTGHLIDDGRALDDSHWTESEHPRADDGRFGSGPGHASKAKPAKGTKTGSGSGSDDEPSDAPAKRGSASAALKPLPADRSEWPEHVKALALPPAWTDVRANPDPAADLQAIGKDSKGRAQYVYSEAFSKAQSAKKFERIKQLQGEVARIESRNAEDRKSSDAKIRDSADAFYLVKEMGLRPGGDDDTGAEKKAYGATTLEGRHVVETDDGMRLQFVGKKGVDIDLPVSDPDVAAMLRSRKEAAGDGPLFPATNATKLLDYTHNTAGEFKTKDFRTLKATTSAMSDIAGMEAPTDPKSYERAVREVAKRVSARLGNTPTICLQSYISPVVFAGWRSAIGGLDD